jgi:hypothetical protein
MRFMQGLHQALVEPYRLADYNLSAKRWKKAISEAAIGRAGYPGWALLPCQASAGPRQVGRVPGKDVLHIREILNGVD